jgi:hypothetical protein
MTLARRVGVVAAQAGKAAWAAVTAAAISAVPPEATSAVCSPVAGLKTGVWLRPATVFPEIRCAIRFMPVCLARPAPIQSAVPGASSETAGRARKFPIAGKLRHMAALQPRNKNSIAGSQS